MNNKMLFLILLLYSCNKVYSQDRMDLPIIEDFEKDTAWIWFPWMQVARSNSAVNKGCAHSGKFGLNCINDYVIRNDLQIGFPGLVSISLYKT